MLRQFPEGALRILKPKERSVEQRLLQFSDLCNKGSPHPRDWRRFYLFAVYAHQRRAQWDEFDSRSRLRALGFDERHAAEFSGAYWHIRCALHMTKPRLINESYHGWMKAGGIPST
jgi:hypothetical protein